MNILLLFPGFIIAFIIVLCYECKMKRTEQRNKVHFYVARDKNGKLYLYMGKPVRVLNEFTICNNCNIIDPARKFSQYGLNAHDFDCLKWKDEPVEVFINMED